MLSEPTQGRVLVDGDVTGVACVLSEPLSLWGGFDPELGVITDVHHPEHGRSIAGSILVMRSGRGSSSASSVLAEAVRLGSAPAAFVIAEPDEILVLGALVGFELYRTATPVIVLPPEMHRRISDGQRLEIQAGGIIVPAEPQ